MAHLVAAIEEGGVGDVFDMLQAMKTGVFLYLATAKGKQRPHHQPVDGENAVEPGKACAAEEVDEKGLGGVVAMVGGKDSGVAMEGT